MDLQPKLFDTPIQLERSDVRMHVSPATKRVLIFRTADAQKLLENFRAEFPEVRAFQDGVSYATARGMLVPCDRMPNLRILDPKLPDDCWARGFRPDHNTTTKGRRAADLVLWLLDKGRIPLWFRKSDEPDDMNVQRKGTDIVIWARIRIQVKCDWEAGPVNLGGSGNIFLQTAELNPLKRY